MFFALIIGLVGLMALLYAIGTIRGRPGKVAEYYVFTPVLVGSALGVVFARSLLETYVFWEIATFAIWRMVAFRRGGDDVAASSWTWLVNFGASTLMLVGMAMILFEHHSLNLGVLAGKPVSAAAAGLILVGILAKSATLPLYVWLPKAYRAAPTSVCALLSGIAENIGVVLFYKLFVRTMSVPDGFMSFVAGLAIVSGLIAGGVALRARTIRETLAYSTISQLGFVFLGLAVAGYYGLLGALLYVMGHAVAKVGLFFSTGLIEDSAGTGELDRLGGAARSSPVLAVATAVLAMSIIGLPPLVGFFAKFGVVLGAIQRSLLLGVGALLAALFTLLYLLRLYTKVFLSGGSPGLNWRPINAWLVGIVVLLALVTLAGGVLVHYQVRFIEPGIRLLTGVT